MDLDAMMEKRVGDLSPREMAQVLRRMGVTAETFAALADNQVSPAGYVDETRKRGHEGRVVSAAST